MGFAPSWKASEQSHCSCTEDDDGTCSAPLLPPAAECGLRTKGHHGWRQHQEAHGGGLEGYASIMARQEQIGGVPSRGLELSIWVRGSFEA